MGMYNIQKQFITKSYFNANKLLSSHSFKKFHYN